MATYDGFVFFGIDQYLQGVLAMLAQCAKIIIYSGYAVSCPQYGNRLGVTNFTVVKAKPCIKSGYFGSGFCFFPRVILDFYAWHYNYRSIFSVFRAGGVPYVMSFSVFTSLQL